MIRRDEGDDWLLISQVDHAHLAAEIAAAWNGEAITPLPWRDELLPAIRHHDDGWAAWEPTVDPETGKPRNFTEMLLPVAVDIWTNSIERCREISPQAGLWVSGHFCFLAERALENRKKEYNAAESAVLQTFLDQQKGLQSDCFDSLPAEHIDRGFRFVQFFDRISLWICCARRDRPAAMTTPFGEHIEFSPIDTWTMAISPAALAADVELTVTARRIPAHRYANDRDLQATVAEAKTERLTWILCNAG